MVQVLIACGYSKHGKDFLFRQFNGETPFNWLVLSHPQNFKPFIIEPVTRIALADELKKDVLSMLNLPPDFDVESNKDSLVIQGKILRTHFIEHGAYKRVEDPDYWCKKAFSNYFPIKSYMVTDWRFPNELDYIKKFIHPIEPVTVRVFRSCVPIPSIDNISERSLDKVETDFVLIPSIYDFEALVQQFPQYEKYEIVTPQYL